MPSSHLLCCPLLLLPPTPPSIKVFSNESTLHMKWPKYWSFSFSIIPSKEHPGLIFRMGWYVPSIPAFWRVFIINGCWILSKAFSAFSKTSLNQFMVHVLLKPGLQNFEHYFTSVWDGCNCAVVWTFFGIAFLWDWNENRPFPVLWPLLSFPNLLAYRVQHFHSIILLCIKLMRIYCRVQGTLLCDDINGKEMWKRGDTYTHTHIYIHIHKADSFCCIVEINTTF